MAAIQIGTVCELWRFPIKSMLGEKLAQLTVGINGTLGDRAYALREVATGRVASAKKWGGLFRFSARYASEPRADSPGEILITTPDGKAVPAEDPQASEIISKAIGATMRLERPNPGEVAPAGIDPATVFAGIPVDQIFPGMRADQLPDYFRLLRGSFFDSATMHIIATGTLDHLKHLRPGTGDIDPRRFRANIYVKSGSADEGFAEDGWLGHNLGVGERLVIKDLRPALRCVMTTLPQSELPRDLGILRTTARCHQNNLGVFCAIERAGIVRLGDPVFLLD
jgi:uncharacterized protein YcbX